MIIGLEIELSVSNRPEGFLKQLPGFDFVEELEKDRPEENFFLGLISLVNDFLDQETG